MHRTPRVSQRSSANCNLFLSAGNAVSQGNAHVEMAGQEEQSQRILTLSYTLTLCWIPGFLLLHIEASVRLIGFRITLTWLLSSLLEGFMLSSVEAIYIFLQKFIKFPEGTWQFFVLFKVFQTCSLTLAPAFSSCYAGSFGSCSRRSRSKQTATVDLSGRCLFLFAWFLNTDRGSFKQRHHNCVLGRGWEVADFS